MLTFHISTSFSQRRNCHPADSQIPDTYSCADNVNNRIYRAYLMEMYLIYRKAVSSGLCFRYQTEHLLSQAARLLILQAIDDVINIMDISVNMVMVVIMSVISMAVIMLMLFMAVVMVDLSMLMLFVAVVMVVIVSLLFQMHVKIVSINTSV